MDQNSANRDENSVQAKLRRRRNDSNNRDYSCGCGKSYLSYAALYTHLKYDVNTIERQKHDSKAPDGTQLPNNANQRPGRGRPRRQDDQDRKSAKSDEGQSESGNEPDDILEELLTFLDSLGSFRQTEKLSSDVDIQAFLLSNFPQTVFSNYQEYQGIFDLLKDITDEKIKVQDIDQIANEPFDKDKSLRKTNITKILAYFLIQIGPKLNAEAYREMCIFIICFQKCLNTLGYFALQKYYQDQKNGDNKQLDIKEEVSQNQEFCDVQNGEHMLLISNEFILTSLPQSYSGLEKVEKSFKIFGSCAEKLKNAVYVTQHFSYWLYSLKFTNSRLDFYTEDD
ncbi:unnamed protein product (macronuclear) [Paramecium tetraurelia]|uniref:C2H2-type domain-containing protein n=1 Tax=Paramecium tetraurelia TaxID=5888 RepID=A0DF89_PARTE|nr:uncharacterized protein GSPATT00016519001 [Paramecium tetraurelia]CAK81706.1 unnamed protein product [Paramecium tetraurelia]|eukprot:XP_001449103.1 hypothetical protein (macronuclear) [Paramecium tetraurelia strain d4-2]